MSERNTSGSTIGLDLLFRLVLARGLDSRVNTGAVISEKDLIALATHLNKLGGGSLTRRAVLFRGVRDAVLVLSKDLDRSLIPVNSGGHRDRVKAGQQCTLARWSSPIDFQPSDPTNESSSAVIWVVVALREPRVGQALIDGEPALWVDNEHGIDQINCKVIPLENNQNCNASDELTSWVAHRIPVRRGVVESPASNLLG